MGRKVNYVDYQVLLDYYEKKRILARRAWQVIGKIKDLKEGYLSQAVHKIYQLIIQHNALVVMEDLNSEFKAKRSAKVEKAVYKNFELVLAKKLNHLILKDKNPDELGGVLKGYQLTPKIEAGKIGDFEKARQWGILFYVPPYYTSITDPITGWRKHKRNYISNSETQEAIQIFFNPDTGVKIDYDQSKQCFKFAYDNDGKYWELFAFDGLQRFRWDSKDRKVKTYNLYEEFENLFASLDESKNINQQIYGKNFEWKTLVFLWNLLNQIRNTDRAKTGNENDFLQSPVWSVKYEQFFDSRKVTVKNLPYNGDANGAYNIARKGAMLLKRIKKSPDNPNLFISLTDWDAAAQDWEKYVGINAPNIEDKAIMAVLAAEQEAVEGKTVKGVLKTFLK